MRQGTTKHTTFESETRRITDYILEIHRNTVTKVYMLSESITVFAWLSSEKTLPMFVAIRVSMILDSTTTDTWRHVKEELNTADLGARGLT